MFTSSGLRRLIALILITGAVVLASQGRAQAADSTRLALVVPVSDLIDPANESLIIDSIARANRESATLIVLQLDSWGATDVQTSRLVAAVQQSAVPVAVWIGPSGGEARGVAAELAIAAAIVGMSSDATIGPAHPLRVDRTSEPDPDEVADQLAALALRNGRSPEAARRVATKAIGTDEALAAGIIDVAGSTLQEFVGNLDGRTIVTARGPQVIRTAEAREGTDERTLTVVVQLTGLSLAQQLSHALTSPSLAYLLLVAGFALIVFEFFAASIGVAGVCGALALVAAFTGFGHLPMHWWAIALIAFGVFGFAVDVQVGRFGVWSVIGFVAALVGSIFLYGGASSVRPAWWVIGLVMLGLVLFMLGGMTGIVRTRFSTSTIGREGLIGAMGTADVDIDPDGVAFIDDARWTARTNRATPIKAGEPLRVVSVEGFVLEVEPEAGGAIDYRERARSRRTGSSTPEPGTGPADDPVDPA